MNHFQKLTLLAVLGLIASNVSLAQDSLRDRFRDQNQPKATVYPEGFEESLADYQQTWETILSNSDLYIIFDRVPEGLLGMPFGTERFAVFKSGDNIFAPLEHLERRLIWKGAVYDCDNPGTDRIRYIEPLALTNSNQDGFANFRSRFAYNELSLRYFSADIEFEVNFDSGECYYSRESFFGLPPEVKQCTVRKYDRDDQQLSNWSRNINYDYDQLLSGIRDVSDIREACKQP